jgi:hypothetical protein
MEDYMDLFKSNVDKMEEEILKQSEKDKKRSRSLNITRYHKKYGTKKPEKRVNQHDIYTAWREDL